VRVCYLDFICIPHKYTLFHRDLAIAFFNNGGCLLLDSRGKSYSIIPSHFAVS
jgi:hypothetical protein